MVHILVVSPDPSHLAWYASLLQHERFHLETASSSEEALTLLLRQREPRVVLIDVTMPPQTLIGLLTIIAVTPALRIDGTYAGVGALPVVMREEITQLMDAIAMHLIEVTADSFPLTREVTRLALRLQAVF